jgi:hypothetical protein
MTATEELRRLLDERVVEWHDTKIGKGFITVYEHDGITWVVTEHSSGRLSVKGCVKPTQGHYDGMTPAQAIAATLGVTDATLARQPDVGTCHADETETFECLDSRYKSFDYNPYITVHVMECSECGRTYEHVFGDYEHCPHCGRRIEVTDD